MKRALIIGPGGAGKSTLTRRLGEITGLPVLHLDARYWRPGWVAPDPEVWSQMVAALIAGERWIIDGNYSRTLPQRLARADTVIWLLPHRIIACARVLLRTVRNFHRSRPDMAEGCRERFDMEFLTWVWRYNERTRDATERVLDQYGRHADIHILRSKRDVNQFVRKVQRVHA